MKCNVELQRSESEGVTTIVGTGQLDSGIVEEFEKALDEGRLTLMPLRIDFRTADYIDSAILQAIAHTANLLAGRGQRLRIMVSSGSQPEYVLRTVGFGEVMDIIAEDG
jgi:anti-anti-sigma regulatory factor